MPKIRIKERDLTTNAIYGVTNNDILVVDNFSKLEGDEPKILTEEELEGAVSIDFLKEVLSLGGRVVGAKTWQNALDYCGDRNQYDIKFILAKEGGTAIAEGPAQSELEVALKIAQLRKDCVVVYTKTSTTYNEIEEGLLTAKHAYIGTSNDSDPDKKFFSDELKTPVGKYVLAFYAPGAGIHDAKREKVLDAGKAFILAFLNNVNNGLAEGLAVAGSVRGYIPFNYTVDGFLKEADIDNMQLRTNDEAHLIAINPIVKMNPWGTRIWGNRTCLPNNQVTDDSKGIVPGTDQLVASSFANIRIAICNIKKAMYKASRKYQFEQNSDVLWVNFTSEVNSLLEEMKSSYIIAGYRWVRDLANEVRGEVRAILKIEPIEAVEDFTLTVELKDSLDEDTQIAE